MKINFENISVEFKFKLKIINKIIEIKDCIINKENKDLNQHLKNQEVEKLIKDKKANGEISTNTLIII